MRTFATCLAARRHGVAPAAGEVGPLTGPGRGRLEVIGAGFGRTGTMSAKIALEQLGFGPCYHMTEIVKNPFHARLWRMAHSGQPVDWAELFSNYRATMDWPACHYYRELMNEFADAKIILTIRDSGRWYESMTNTLYSLKTAADARLRIRQDRLGSVPGSVPAAAAPGNRIWRDTFSGDFGNREHAIAIYERHNAEVIRTVPADRLLVYRVSEGWPPLCEFLGVEVPQHAFPHVNTTQSFREYNSAELGGA